MLMRKTILLQYFSRIDNGNCRLGTKQFEINSQQHPYKLMRKENKQIKTMQLIIIYKMNLKQQISKFRSEILIGKYPSAISIAKDIMQKLSLMQQIGIANTSDIRQQIQIEYEKCLVVNNLIKAVTIKEEEGVKKWGAKTPQRKHKWAKKEEEHVGIISPIYHKGDQIQTSQVFQADLSLEEPQHSQQYTSFIQKLQKQIMLPLKMPNFFNGKSQVTKSKIVRAQIIYYSEIINYFVENQFFRVTLQELKHQLNQNQLNNFLTETKTKQIIAECSQNQIEEIPNLHIDSFYVIFIVASDRFTLENL